MTDGKKYFQSTKRGELSDLREELNSTSRDKQKEAVKKVIAAMSVGKDVSALFADVINCVQATSIETKKLVYLYVINYAKSQPDLAILAVNTFRKDALDPNPLIRALAVRTMGYIRLDAVAEYLMDPVRRCCRDSDPYVRKTAALSVAKLYAIAPEMIEEQGLIEILQGELITDANPMVVANTVGALSEISSMSGRNCFDFLSKSDAANILLSALNECNEWAQVMILDVLAANYKPSDSKDAMMVVDRVTARLSHSNAAVALAAVRVVVGLLDRLGSVDAVRNSCKKLSAPLITLLAEAEPEIQYIALRNISLIMAKYPAVLAGEVKVFFCKYNDPVYVKLEKLEALVHMVSDKTADSVLSELKEYASEVDLEFVRKSVRCIGRFAIRVESAADKCVSALLELIETKISYVVQEAVVVMRDIFRRFPGRYESVISALCDNLDSLDIPEAKAAMVWILGEYADRIDNSGELIESLLGSANSSFIEESYEVQLELLTASVKYFLKVKDASHATLVKVLNMCTEESDNPDIRDRAFIYWRLLSIDPELCRQAVTGPKPLIVDDVGNDVEGEVLNKLIREIGTLASVYHEVPNSFAVRQRIVNGDNDDEDMDEDELERAERLAKVRSKLASGAVNAGLPTNTQADARKPSSDSEDDGSEESDSDEDSSDDEEPVKYAVPDLKVAKLTVLPVSAAAGSKGTSGLGIDACLGKTGKECTMLMSIRNSTSAPLTQLAIQFNKNSFGLGPKTSAMDIGNRGVLEPGSAVEISVPLDWNKLNSGTPPSDQQLTVQVAVRTNIDIFYFVVPFDLHVVLDRSIRTGINSGNFAASWEALKTSEKTVQVKPCPRDRLLPRMYQGGLVHVTDSPSGQACFVSKTCNNLLVLCLIDPNTGRCHNIKRIIALVFCPCVCLVPYLAILSQMKRSSSMDPMDRTKRRSDEATELKPVEPEDSELEFEDDYEDEFDQEEIYDAQYEDAEIDEEDEACRAEPNPNVPAPSVFRPGIDELEPGQVLEPEPGTYKMLHRLEVQWPCLSFDVLPDALGENRTKFPMTSYVVSGTQADKAEKNKLVVMKWSNLQKTNKDGIDDDDDEDEINRKYKLDEDSESEDEDNDEDPDLEFRMIKHCGGVNRVRAMPQMSTLVASWSDNGSVYVHNVFAELESLEGRGKVTGNNAPVHVFSEHTTEGFALGWNPHQVGQMVTGDCDGGSYLWTPSSGGTWAQSKILQDSKSSFSSVEDIEFRKIGDNCANIFALCGGELGKVGIVDVRNPGETVSEFVAHKGDTNVLSWNPIVGQLLLTGGDDGSFKVWDIRATSRGALANFKWHKGPVTSVDWHPRDEAVLAVSSEDDTTSIWDMSVEEDQSAETGDSYYPPQLLFLHMGQQSIKEIKFHKQLPGVIVSTALDGFNIFKTFNIV